MKCACCCIIHVVGCLLVNEAPRNIRSGCDYGLLSIIVIIPRFNLHWHLMLKGLGCLK